MEVEFNGGHLSIGGGVLLLRETDRPLGLGDKLARCFSENRPDPLLAAACESPDLLAVLPS